MQAELSQELLDTVSENGIAMLRDLDFVKEFEVLELGFFDWTIKKNLSRELISLYIALWKFALKRSFPNDLETIYQTFLQKEDFLKSKEKAAIIQYADGYFHKLHERGIDDFTTIAHHILSFKTFDETKVKTYTLKLVLIFRANYTHFFEHLL